MAAMHSLLKRQLKRYLGDPLRVPAEWQAFVDGVNEAYQGFDADRALLEHSLELSSQELLDANAEMRAVFHAIPDLVFRVNHRGIILDVKGVASGELTMGRQELMGKRLEDTPLKEVAAQFAAAVAQVIAKSSEVLIEYSAVHQGQESDYEARLVPLPDEQIVVIIRNITERKQSLRLLAAAVEQSTESVTIADIELDFPGPKILFVNPAFTKMTGYTASEAVGQTPRILQGPKSDRATMRRMRETLKRGENFKGETINYRKDGTEFNLEWEVTPIRNSSGQPTHFLGIQRDITASKRAAALLSENRQRLALATESAHIGIWDWDVVADVMVWDAQMYALYGLGETDFTGAVDGWQKRLHPEDRKRAEGEIALAISGVADFDSEFRIMWSNGDVRYIEAHGVVQRAGDGSPSRMIGVNWDVTARKRSEHALRESNEKFRQLAETITDAFWIRSPDMREVRYISPAFEPIWGRSVASLYADPQQWTNCILSGDRERVQAAFATLAGDTPSIDVEYRIERPNGEIRWVQVRGFQVRSAAHELISLTGIVTDISERKRAEFELAEAHNQLLALSRQAGMAEFATGILHNVGNVLNSVNVASTCVADSLRRSKSVNLAKVVALLQEHEGDLGTFFASNPKGRQVPLYLAYLAKDLAAEQTGALKELADFQKNIGHIRDIITDQQRRAKTTGKREMVDVTELVADAVRMGGLAPSEIAIHECSGIPPILAEKHKALQILVNLLRNSRQSCEASDQPEKKLRVHTTVELGRVQIAVSDNGVGISPENLARIFTHGFTTKKDGHGFGLHSSALAAKALGGALTVQSDGPGRGATFTLELPVTAAVATPVTSVA